jgi:pimeloyl-ACP methyl ester carboxylesterase
VPDIRPTWLSEADIDSTPANSRAADFAAPSIIVYYRNHDRNWELMAAFDGMSVAVPALYLACERTWLSPRPGMAEYIANLKQVVPTLKGIQMFRGCGHWTQQERPAEVSAAIINFLRSLPGCPLVGSDGQSLPPDAAGLALPRFGRRGLDPWHHRP